MDKASQALEDSRYYGDGNGWPKSFRMSGQFIPKSEDKDEKAKRSDAFNLLEDKSESQEKA